MYINVYEYHKMYQLCCEIERINAMSYYELIGYCKENMPHLVYDINKSYYEYVALRQTVLLIKLSDLSVMFSRNK